MIVEQFCRIIDAQLSQVPNEEEKVACAAKALSQIFGVRRDEVAIFSFDPRFEVLRFSWPVQLQSAGVVPLSSDDALVARTVRQKKGYVDNAFASSPHLFIFETFKLDLTGGIPIQKILSVPLMRGAELRGAIQISRKGTNAESAGLDFTREELDALSDIAAVMAAHL